MTTLILTVGVAVGARVAVGGITVGLGAAVGAPTVGLGVAVGGTMVGLGMAVRARVAVGGTTVGLGVGDGGGGVGDGADVAVGGTTVVNGAEAVLVTAGCTRSSDDGTTVDASVVDTDGTASDLGKAADVVDRSATWATDVGRLASLSTKVATKKTAPKLTSKSASPIRATITTIKSGLP